MDKKKTVLVVDDEASMRTNMKEVLEGDGLRCMEAADGNEAIEKVKRHVPSLVLLDINLPHRDGLSVLKEIQKLFPRLPVIIFTAYGTSERAIEAMKSGAFDYMEKPFELDEFLITIKRALEYSDLIEEVNELRGKVLDMSTGAVSDQIIGRSSQMQAIFKLIGKVAPTDATVLIQGESGTGKELIADAIQRHSLRFDKPYVKVNCGALTETLLESEIFGHEKGSFTGASSQKLGRFELAEGGTVFLDEINNMPLSLQVKLLRILQKQPFYRVGGETPIKADVRIIAASNTDIEKSVKEGKLREDLFYRLNVVRINIPELRQRKEDIPLLIEHFVKKHSGGKKITVTHNTISKLSDYDWPGNIRELENTIQRALVVSNKNFLTIDQLPISSSTKDAGTGQKTDGNDFLFEQIVKNNKSLKEIISGIEKELITRVLEVTGQNRSNAAKVLKIHRRLLYTKMKDYKIKITKQDT